MAKMYNSRRFRRRFQWSEFLEVKQTEEKLRQWWKSGLAGTFILTLAVTLYFSDSSQAVQNSQPAAAALTGGGPGRRLLATNTTNHAEEGGGHGVEWESCDWELAHSPYAWLFNHLVFIFVIFVALAIICDDFFVPSLEAISEKLNLSEDVAGATFMAAGSSAPELFSSVAGVIQQSDVGVGTIVGSAVFNLLIIIALTAALAGQVLELDWRPLARDSFFYAMSIGCFIGFAWDGLFTHYESVILLLLYVMYIILMVFNPRIMTWMGTWSCACTKRVEPVEDGDKEKTAETQLNGTAAKDKDVPNGDRRMSLTGGHAKRLSILHHEHEGDHHFHHKRGSIAGALECSTHPAEALGPPSEVEGVEDEEEEGPTMNLCPCLPCCPLVRTSPPEAPKEDDEKKALNWAKFVLKWVLFVPSFPFLCLFSWTIPDCSKPKYKKWYLVSFLVSVFWIAALSFGMVTLVGRSGCITNVDSYVMGVLVIAVGTSVPDCLSSILVARDGYGDMAVSNAIGSNVFDINLGLGAPFLIRILIDHGAPIVLLDTLEMIDYKAGLMPIVPHAKFGFILLLILIIAVLIFYAVRFKLNKWVGISFVCMYIIFLAYTFTQERYCKLTLHQYC